MTSTLGTNAKNDLYLLPTGSIPLLTGQPAVQAGCLSASKAQLAEMIYAMTSGLPNFQTVWVGAPNISIFEQYLRNAIQNVDGVIKVSSLQTSVVAVVVNGRSKKALSYTAIIENEFGSDITIQQEIVIND